MRSTSTVLLALILATLLAACGGGGAPTPEAPSGTPPPAAGLSVPTAIGEPIGARVAAAIGPDGGLLTSADGGLTVEVPAGAFDREREVAIEEIANHAHGRVGRAWRLTPEGLITPLPMTLRFHHTAEELRGTTAALLGIATQAADGTWRVHRRPAHDAATSTLAVQTRHFSDWSKVAGAQLLPGAAAVQVNDSVELRVLRCEYVEDPDSDDLHVPLPDELRRCHTEPLWNWTLRDWSVNGSVGGGAALGTIEAVGDAQLGEALYTAPGRVPASNPVAVSVKLPDLFGTGEQTLVSHITVSDGSSCAQLRNRTVWNATWGLRYQYDGANEDGDTLRSTLRADLTARLIVESQSANGVSLSGPATGTFQFDQEHVEQGATPRVITAAGHGAPYVDAQVADGTHVTLNIDFRTCQYSTGITLVTPLLLADDGSVEALPRVWLGSAHAVAPRAVPASGTLSGGGAFTAHTPLWGLQNPQADLWLPVAGDPFNSGFEAEGQAGAASVEWSLAPEGD